MNVNHDDDPLLGAEPQPVKKPKTAFKWTFVCLCIPILFVWAVLLGLTVPQRSLPWPKQDPASCLNHSVAFGNYTGTGIYATSSILENARVNIFGALEPGCGGADRCLAVFHGKLVSKYGEQALTGRNGSAVYLDNETCKLRFSPRLNLPGGIEQFLSEWDTQHDCFFWEARTLVGDISGRLCRSDL